MATPHPEHEPLHEVVWEPWVGGGRERFSLRWDNGGWTAEGTVHGPDVHYVVRFAPDWSVRQFLLFRDLDDPDLWLATDAAGRWGEMNGSYRHDLDGCTAVDIDVTPFTAGIPALQHDAVVGPGGHVDVTVARVDVETLELTRVPCRYVRVAVDRWRVEGTGPRHELTLDAHGLVLDAPGAFRRTSR